MLTDNEIKKFLKWCEAGSITAKTITISNNEMATLCDLINRLQADVKHLDDESDALRADIDFLEEELKTAKAENEILQAKIDGVQEANAILRNNNEIAINNAIKEFAERLKEQKYQSSDWSHGEHPYVVEESDIDNTSEDLVGDNNG